MAAKALPMIIVKIAMPTAYTMMPTTRFPLGITLDTICAMTSPTPAAVNTEPSAASSVGSMLSGPTISIMRRQSCRKTFGLLSRE